MIDRDPKCVYVADSAAKADVIALFLNDHEIPAQVMNQNTIGSEDLTGKPPGVLEQEFEVRVIHPEQAEAALALMKAHAEALAAEKATRAARTGTVTVVCEECGKSVEFPASEQGTVQECPLCAKWVDVPDPDDNWDIGDGNGDADETEPTED